MDHSTDIMTSIHSLPREIMAMIFSHLSCRDKVSAACVCSHWRDLIDIPSVWKNFCPLLNVDNLTSKHTEKMRIRLIRKVKVVACSSMEKMTAFLQALPCLKDLFLFPLISLDRLHAGDKAFPTIEYFTISTFFLEDCILQSFLQPMINLKVLTLICIPDQNIFCALKDLKHLASLSIKSPSVGINIAGPSVGDLLPKTSLKKLTLENVTMVDSGLELISRAFPMLQTLQLIFSPNVTSDGLKNLAKLTKLKILKIVSRYFQLDWMKHLQTGLSKLEHLRLYGCKSISKECLQSISRMSALSVLRVPIQNQEVEGLRALSQGCRGLQTLHLVNGNASINQGLHVVRDMPKLQVLTLQNCEVNDDFWRENSKTFHKLRKLLFIKCQLLSEHCLLYLSKLPCLEKLFVIKCKTMWCEGIKHHGEKGEFQTLIGLALIELGIKDENLVELSKSVPSLKTLISLSCNNITENGLVAAVSNLSSLKVLKANLCAETKQRLRGIQPSLKFYTQ